jgi:hypothetical protein
LINLTLFQQAEGNRSGAQWFGARLLPRFYLNPQLHNSDVAYLHPLARREVRHGRPEAHAAALREALAVSLN